MQSNSSFAVELMNEIGHEIGKTSADMAPFTEMLVANWIDTREAFISLNKESIAQLGFPIGLQQKLLEKLEKIKEQKAGETSVHLNL